MPRLITNNGKIIFKPQPSQAGPVGSPTSNCTSTYDQYVDQRIEEPVVTDDIKDVTERFKLEISDPLNQLNQHLEMGQYFVIPVAELRKMIDEPGDKPEFIHICNALRDTKNSDNETKTFPVAILVPYKRTTANADIFFARCENANSVYIEAYPCPPAQGCPNNDKLREGIFKPTVAINFFTNLF